MGSNFVQENQPYPPFGRLPRLGRRVLAALAEINPNRHFVALLPRLGRLIPLIALFTRLVTLYYVLTLLDGTDSWFYINCTPFRRIRGTLPR